MLTTIQGLVEEAVQLLRKAPVKEVVWFSPFEFGCVYKTPPTTFAYTMRICFMMVLSLKTKPNQTNNRNNQNLSCVWLSSRGKGPVFLPACSGTCPLMVCHCVHSLKTTSLKVPSGDSYL